MTQRSRPSKASKWFEFPLSGAERRSNGNAVGRNFWLSAIGLIVRNGFGSKPVYVLKRSPTKKPLLPGSAR